MVKSTRPVNSSTGGRVGTKEPAVGQQAVCASQHPIVTDTMLPMEEEYKVSIESRVPESLIKGLASMGMLVQPLPRYDYHMGSYQMSWRADDGTLRGAAGPRRSGAAAGF